MDTQKACRGVGTPQQAERGKKTVTNDSASPYTHMIARRSSFGKRKPQPRPYARQVKYYRIIRSLLRRWQACKARGLSQDAAWHARAFIRLRLRIASQMGTQWESWIVWGARLAVLADRKETD